MKKFVFAILLNILPFGKAWLGFGKAWLGCSAQVTIVVSNPTDVQRQELIEVSFPDICQRLGIKEGEPFTVKNAIGQEVDYQVTYDKKLLVDASVQPNKSQTFTVDKGIPAKATDFATLPVRTAAGGFGVGKVWCHGQLYPDRLDDIAWENDRGAYRVYGPAFQKAGQIGYGPDIWVKNTPELDVNRRFRMDIDIKPTQKQLEDAGLKAEAAKLVQDNSFHIDHGTGNDCYAVGATLGGGGAAMLQVINNKEKGTSEKVPVFVNGWETGDIVDNGPLRFTVNLTYPDTVINGIKYKQHRNISLDKGSNFNKVEVWYSLSPQPSHLKGKGRSLTPQPPLLEARGSNVLTVVSGFPLHAPNEKTLMLGKDYIQYADPTDNPVSNSCELYLACLYPTGTVKTQTAFGHALGETTLKPDEHWTYYAGTAWSKYDVRNQQEWQCRINTTLNAIKNPLTVTIK